MRGGEGRWRIKMEKKGNGEGMIWYPKDESFLRSSEEWYLMTIFTQDLREISFFERSSRLFFKRSFEDFLEKIFLEDC